jgi:hypothetical protein
MTRYRLFVLLGCVGAAVTSAAVHAATVVPSIEITGIVSGAANNCSQSGLEAAVILNNPGVESDNYEIYNGSTLLYRWTGETYPGTGANQYGLSSSAFTTLPPDSPLTGIIYTFPTSSIPATPYTPDKYSYKSAITWDCTTGALISIVNTVGGGPVVAALPVPALRPARLAALALALFAMAAAVLTRGGPVRRG